MFRRVIETILLTLIQIIGIFFVHYIFYSNYPMRHKEVGFGIAIYFTGIIFIVLLFIYNLLLEFYKKHIYSSAIIFLITSSYFPLMAMNFRPFRSLLLIILLIFGFISSIILSKWRKNKFKL